MKTTQLTKTETAKWEDSTDEGQRYRGDLCSSLLDDARTSGVAHVEILSWDGVVLDALDVSDDA